MPPSTVGPADPLVRGADGDVSPRRCARCGRNRRRRVRRRLETRIVLRTSLADPRALSAAVLAPLSVGGTTVLADAKSDGHGDDDARGDLAVVADDTTTPFPNRRRWRSRRSSSADPATGRGPGVSRRSDSPRPPAPTRGGDTPIRVPQRERFALGRLRARGTETIREQLCPLLVVASEESVDHLRGGLSISGSSVRRCRTLCGAVLSHRCRSPHPLDDDVLPDALDIDLTGGDAIAEVQYPAPVGLVDVDPVRLDDAVTPRVEPAAARRIRRARYRAGEFDPADARPRIRRRDDTATPRCRGVAGRRRSRRSARPRQFHRGTSPRHGHRSGGSRTYRG